MVIKLFLLFILHEIVGAMRCGKLCMSLEMNSEMDYETDTGTAITENKYCFLLDLHT